MELFLVIFFETLLYAYFTDYISIIHSYNLCALFYIYFIHFQVNHKGAQFFCKYRNHIVIISVLSQLILIRFNIQLEFLQNLLIAIMFVFIREKMNEEDMSSGMKQKRLVNTESYNIFNYLGKGCFLYKETTIDSVKRVNLLYSNMKAKNISTELDCDIGEITENLVISESNKILKYTLEEFSLNQQNQGEHIKAIVSVKKRLNSSQSIPFKSFKCEIWRLTKFEILMILTEQLGEKTLNYIEGFKDSIICTLSHELKTFANGLIGSIELMIDNTNLSNEDKVNYGIAICSSYLLSNRLKDLFDQIQIKNKGFRLHYSEFPLDDLTEILRKVCCPYAAQKQLNFIITQIGKVPKTIVCDKDRVQQVLMNLLSKIIDFTDYGNVILEIESKKNGQISFKVRSTGDSTQKKLEHQINKLSPESKHYRKQSTDLENITASIKNFDALSLEISQIICNEMGTKIIHQAIPGKWSQLEFTINDGFTASNASGKTECFKRSNTYRCFTNFGLKSRRLIKETYQIKEFSKAMNTIIEEDDMNSTIVPRTPFIKINKKDISDIDEIHNEISEMCHIRLPSSKAKVLINGLPSFTVSRKISAVNLLNRFQISQTMTFQHSNRRKSCFNKIPRIIFDDNKNFPAEYIMLVVDDDAINRRILRELLKRLGYKSIEAKDGGEAITLIEGYIKSKMLYEVQMIFMDLQMPILNGIMATGRIMELSKKANQAPPPIIGVTADPIESDKRNFLKAGLKQILSKPVDSKKLRTTIQKYIIQN